MQTLPFILYNKPVDYSQYSDEELLAVLKKVTDFDRFVFPSTWYQKFGDQLPEKKCLNVKEYLQEAPWMKTSQHFYIGKVDLAPAPGGVRPVLPAPEVPTVTVLKNSFSDGPDAQLQIKDQNASSDQPTTQQS